MRSPSGTFLRVVAQAAALAGALGVATPAHAQLGKLKKMGADAIKDAAKDKVSDKKPDAKGTGSSASSVKARETFPALTEDKVALVVASLATAGKRAQIKAAAKAARPAHEARQKASNDCLNAAAEKVNPAQMMASAQSNASKLQALGKQQDALQKKTALAQQTKNTRLEVFTRDSLIVLGIRANFIQLSASHCTMDFTPAAILEEEILEREDNGSQGMFDPGAAVRGVLTHREFGLARERIALWGLMQDDPAMKGGPAGIFSEEEVAALKANEADIRKLVPSFKAQTLAWVMWSDVKQWDGPK
jgi:hypothetical protein